MATSTNYPRVHVVIQWAEFGLLDDLAGKPISVEQFNVLASAAAADAPEGGGYNKIKMNVYVDGEDTLEMRHDADRRGSEGRGLRQMMVNRLSTARERIEAVDSGREPEQRTTSWSRQAAPVYQSVLEALTPSEGAADRTPRRKTSAHTTRKTRTRSAPKKPNRQATPQGISPASSADVSALGLNAVLAQLGYTTEPGRHAGTKDVRRNSTGMYAQRDATAGEIWDWLRSTNQIPQTDELARMPRLKIGDRATDSKRFHIGLVIQNPAGTKTYKVQKMGADGDVFVSELRKNGTWIKKPKELGESWLRFNFPSQGYRVIADPAKKKAAKFNNGQRVSFDIPATAFRPPRFGHGTVRSTNPMSGLLDVDVDGGLVTVISPEHVKKSTKKKPAAKKASKKVSKTTAKKTPAKKRARAKGDDEIRLYKRSGKLIATYGVTYKLTQAMESIRDCARKGTPCKLSTVIKAYEQLRNAARSPGKSPRQGLAYYIAAELAKDLRRSDELEAVGKGDHPRIKEA